MNSFSRICGVCGTVNHASQRRCTTCQQILSESNKRTLVNSTPSMVSLTGKMLKQRYRVLFPVGKGGMGTVYMGKDMQLGSRLVAIKQMSQHNLLSGERLHAARNFQQEAHLLASLHHPNLPSIYDHFEEDQRWYLVMSFVKGQTLEEYLETKGGKLSVGEVLEIGNTLCNVLP